MRGILKYAVVLFFLSWLVVPPGTGVKAQSLPEGTIDGRNPNRTRERREGDPTLEARFIPDSIGIGDRVTLRIEISKDMMQVVELPEFTPEMLHGADIDLVEQTGTDTLAVDGRKMTLRKDITLQVFEDGIVNFGWIPALYLDKNITDTLWTADSLVLFVGTFQIDTLNQTIHDIRGIMPAPVKFGEWGGYTLWGLIALAVIALLVWYYIMRRRNLTMFGKPKVVDPPHVAAIKALEVLHNQKLWQNNRHKQYYTGITDILRRYIEDRYGVGALEMTSDEILTALGGQQVPEKSYTDLSEILSTADLVKFAKYVPDAELNETVFTNAYYFVEETKPDEIEKPEPQEGVKI